MQEWLAEQVCQAKFVIHSLSLSKEEVPSTDCRQVPALLAVGLEGCWGLLICLFALPLLSTVPGPGGQILDDLPAALRVSVHACCCKQYAAYVQHGVRQSTHTRAVSDAGAP